MKFEWYVLNGDFNKRCVEQFNIFRNIHVQERSEKAIKKYLRSPRNYCTENRHTREKLYGFDALCEEIRMIIMCEEWSRCEYEIAVGEMFHTKTIEDMQKVDCYMQCERNIPAITREILYQYKQQLKEKK